MLRFEIKNKDGTKSTIDCVLTVTLNSEIGVPADSLVLTCPYDKELRENADSIFAYNGDTLVFRGQLDEIICVKKSGGVIIKLCARSPASALLDSEAEPLTYINPAANMIFSRHLAPFGIKEYVADDLPFLGSLKIDKGMSHWQVLRNYCKARYATEPLITGSGKVYFEGFKNDDIVTFGEAEGETAYFSLKETNAPCKLISQIKLKLTEFGLYSSAMNNENPGCKGVKRIRCVNAAADNTSTETAEKMINQSNLDSYCLTLECYGCYTGLLGCSAEVNDSVLGKIKDLTVKSLCYTLNASTEKTTVVLQKERF